MAGLDFCTFSCAKKNCITVICESAVPPLSTVKTFYQTKKKKSSRKCVFWSSNSYPLLYSEHNCLKCDELVAVKYLTLWFKGSFVLNVF